MTNPKRVSNPGAESLGFLPNGEEVMAVYVNARPPTVNIFHSQPPGWSSFGNKISWSGNDWVDDSPTRDDIAQRDQEIKAFKDEIEAKRQDNARKLTDTKQKLAAASSNKADAEKELFNAHDKGSDEGEILRHTFKVALAEMNEQALKIEIAGYEAFNLHAEASKIGADADSLRIGTRQADNRLRQAAAKRQEAKNADQRTTQMRAEYEHRKERLDKLLTETMAATKAKLAILEAQKAQLVASQKQDDDATSARLGKVDKNIINEKQKQEDLQQIKNAVKISTDFFKALYSKYGDIQGKIALELADAAKGAQLRNVDEALKSFATFKGNFDNLYSDSERRAIALALESANRIQLAENLARFSKAFGLTGYAIDLYDILDGLIQAVETNNWRPFFVKAETLLVGTEAGTLAAWAFAVILGSPLGVLGFAIVMAAVSALINDSLMEKINKTIGI